MKNIAAKIIGGIIGVLAICGLLFVSTYTETTTEQVVETTQYQTKIEYDSAQREGVRVIKQEGKNGSKTVTYEVTRNYLGHETSRRSIDTKNDKAVQDEIIVVGTSILGKRSQSGA